MYTSKNTADGNQAHTGNGKTQQTANLVLDTIRLAMKQEKKRGTVKFRLYSDQEVQYLIKCTSVIGNRNFYLVIDEDQRIRYYDIADTDTHF